MQLYSLATPNGVKATVMLEELLALGHAGAEYDAWLIKIDGNQFGSGFVAVNPNSKIPALMDRSGPTPIRVFEDPARSWCILPKNSARCCYRRAVRPARSDCLGCSGRWAARRFSAAAFRYFYAYAPTKIEIRHRPRYAMEIKRQLAVLDRQLADNEYLAGHDYTIADIAVWPW